MTTATDPSSHRARRVVWYPQAIVGFHHHHSNTTTKGRHMAKFRGTKVEKIEWDFQLADRLDPDTGKIAGIFPNGHPDAQGKLPEPDPETAQKFANDYRDYTISIQAFTLENMPDDLYTTSRAQCTQMLVDVGVPLALLEQLPPRHFREFAEYIYDELSGNAASVG